MRKIVKYEFMEQGVELNKELYDKTAVQGAIEDFQELADLKLDDSGQYYRVKASRIDDEVRDGFWDEFCNYALFLTASYS